MKTNYLKIIGQTSIVALLCTVVEGLAVERYVNVNNPAPAAPYLTWAAAATTIQAAIDAASNGDTITVTNGVYQTGESELFLTYGASRVSISKALRVQSVNGPAFTVIDGGGTVRCVALVSNAVLSGFTLTNGGATLPYFRQGGGVMGDPDVPSRSAVVTNCLLSGNKAFGEGGGAFRCTLDNCIVSNNVATIGGGGTAISIVKNCLIVNNVAWSGGGASDSVMTNCFIGGNSATNGHGGGATVSTPLFNFAFDHCVFVNNRVTATNGQGGGVSGQYAGHHALLYNCAFTNNSASLGGGAYGGVLYDCVLVGNQATNGAGLGGGAVDARLERCLVLGNTAKKGGGAFAADYDAYSSRCIFGGNSATLTGGGVCGVGTHHLAIITNNFALDGGGGSGYFNTCLFSGNLATNRGGAVYEGNLDSCTVAGNSAGNEGGGISGAAANYSIIYHNSAPLYPNCDTNSAVADSCTTPSSGSNTFTNDPAFVNLAAGDYRLSSNSLCINYLYSPNPPDPQNVDLDGNPRCMGGGIDLGAYEFQSPSSAISYLWLQQHGLPTDGSADYTDPDGDSFNNHSEWRLHTDPFDAASLLKFRSISIVTNDVDPTPYIRLEWPSAPDVLYVLESSSSVTGPFTYLDSIAADSTNAIREIPIDPAENSMFFKLRLQ